MSDSKANYAKKNGIGLEKETYENCSIKYDTITTKVLYTISV